MSLFISSLNSGSNGNCYYVGNSNEAVLIDAGLSCNETEKRLSNLKLSIENVKGIFISHEHIDHIRGAAQLSKKYQLPVYINNGTYKNSDLRLNNDLVNNIISEKKISIGNLLITAFSKHHDAAEPVSFVVEHNGIKAGVMTDIGTISKTVIHYFKQCHACFLETNYDEKMLREGGYPLRLQKRISGKYGHLSNTQALELFVKHKPKYMSHILLSHLSENNNHPGLVHELFLTQSGDVKIIVTSRNEESSLFEIENEIRGELKTLSVKKNTEQLTLF